MLHFLCDFSSIVAADSRRLALKSIDRIFFVRNYRACNRCGPAATRMLYILGVNYCPLAKLVRVRFGASRHYGSWRIYRSQIDGYQWTGTFGARGICCALLVEGRFGLAHGGGRGNRARDDG